ncbi:MAG: histidine kinase [Rhodocyclales bacterium]|nr:histidine kinase [Rhodocyclales bacterium]
MPFSPMQPVGVVVVNALIAGFLSAIGVGNAFAENFIISQCIGLSIYAGCAAALRWAPTPQRRLAGVIAAVPLGATAGVAISAAILGEVDGVWVSAMAWQSLLIGLLFGTAISALFYLRSRMDQLENELKARQLREALAEKERVGAQLRMLQAQIEPHFLFNTLANLSALIRTDAATAERMLADLIRYLRATLQRTREAESTLGDEMELLRNYLDILGLRLGGRLRWTFDVPEALLARQFPLMLLQPLVENAVTHGIEPKVGGGELRIAARLEGGRLHLSVSDTGVGLSGVVAGSGFGLDNVRSRLRALYGEAAALDVRENSGGVTSTIELPA